MVLITWKAPYYQDWQTSKPHRPLGKGATFHMEKQNFYIGADIWIRVTEVISPMGIAVEAVLDGITLAGIMNFSQVDTNPSSGKKTTATMQFTAIMGGPVDLVRMHEATGRLLQNYATIASVMSIGWLKNFFPYPA